ncbi:MAG: polyprenyl synthetase family protein [Candidatus Bathyarchaeia archaeon]
METLKGKKSVAEQNKQKTMVKVLKILHQKSSRALKEAKNQILAEKIESEAARKALEHYIKNWNDTTHPGILALACEAVGGNMEKAVPLQTTMLYLTAALDLHDDLIDHCKIKNGKLTVFGKYGKDITLLLGNAMMIKGFALLYYYSKEFEPKIFEKIVTEIQTKLFDLGNAHLLEADLKGKLEVPPSRYLSILEKKASSIEIYAKIGAIVGGGSPHEIETLARYGKILGMLICLREEFIDIFEPDELKNRMENEILPLPILYALRDVKIKKEILHILSKTKITKREVEKIVEYVFQNEETKKLQKRMQILAEDALNIISELKDKAVVDNLKLLIHGALEDIK